jgi:hypothetical protein
VLLRGGGGGDGGGGGARTRPEMHCLPGFGAQLPRMKQVFICVLMFQEMHAGVAEQLPQQNVAHSVALLVALLLPLLLSLEEEGEAQLNERRIG